MVVVNRVAGSWNRDSQLATQVTIQIFEFKNLDPRNLSYHRRTENREKNDHNVALGSCHNATTHNSNPLLQHS